MNFLKIARLTEKVFIHRSIKTRIETFILIWQMVGLMKFLYIDPLKQGLKPRPSVALCLSFQCFYT